ncbi:hypothetical protein ACWD4L_21025 [Streptomyces sp. NPDC002596]
MAGEVTFGHRKAVRWARGAYAQVSATRPLCTPQFGQKAVDNEITEVAREIRRDPNRRTAKSPTEEAHDR